LKEKKKPNNSQKNSKQKLKIKRKWIKYKIEKKNISILKDEIENKDPKTKTKIVILKNEDQMLNKKNRGGGTFINSRVKLKRKSNISKKNQKKNLKSKE
jgi:hypothetical protein